MAAGWRLLPLLLGLFQLLVTTPVALAAGFGTTAAFVVIALCDLLVAAVGLALVREPRVPEPVTAGLLPQRGHHEEVMRMARWASRAAIAGALIQIGYGLLACVYRYPTISDRPFEALGQPRTSA